MREFTTVGQLDAVPIFEPYPPERCFQLSASADFPCLTGLGPVKIILAVVFQVYACVPTQLFGIKVILTFLEC